MGIGPDLHVIHAERSEETLQLNNRVKAIRFPRDGESTYLSPRKRAADAHAIRDEPVVDGLHRDVD
jgi:hypothetical protein